MSSNHLRKPLLVMVLFCLFMAAQPLPLLYADSEPPRAEQVILILWHGFELQRIEELSFPGPTAWGLLNTRAGGGDLVSGAYLSLGAGARAVGQIKTGAFMEDEDAQALYQLNTGLVPVFIVQPQIAQIIQAQQVNYTVIPGALGTAFVDVGLAVRALGNSDGDELARWAAVVSMDQMGQVFAGEIGENQLLNDPQYPFGVRTNYEQLKSQVLKAREPLVVVDLGDPYRYDRYRQFLWSTQQETIGERVFQEAWEFIQEVARLKSPETVILVLGPHPGQRGADQGLWLTPIVCLGRTEGLFISGTTRWPGLITNMDVAPTILETLGITHDQPFIGRPATIQPTPEPQSHVRKLGERIVAVNSKRSLVLRVVIVGQVVLYSLVLVCLIMPDPLPRQLIRLGQTLLVLFLLIPLVLLLWSGPVWLVATGLFVGVALGFISGDPLLKVGLISLATVIAIAYDVLWGNWLMRFSFLGYDPIGGARFYGLGNEFMGVFVGATVLFWAVLCQRYRLGFIARSLGGFATFSLALLIIGSPMLGTNVGGAICGVFAFGSTWLSFRERRIGWQGVVSLVIVVGVVLVLVMLIDQANPSSEQSHIGQTVLLFQRDGFPALWMIVTRKLAMNLKLLRYSIWSKALLVALVVLGASFIWPSKFIFWLRKTYPLIAKGIGGVVIGSVGAFVFNDSGVVAAATCLYFASTTLLLLALELKHDLHSS